MKKLKIRGRSIQFEERGKGPAIVALEGLEDQDSLSPEQSRSLEKAGFRVIRLDLRSGRAGASALADSISEQVIQALNQLGVGRAVFIGRARGGQIMQDLVRRFPRRVAKIIDLSWRSQRSSETEHSLVECLLNLRSGIEPLPA